MTFQGSQNRPHSFFSALRIGARGLRTHPLLGAVLMAATLAQGVLQGLLVWVLRHVLITFSTGAAITTAALAIGAAEVFAIWTVRVLSTYVGEIASIRLAHKVEIKAMQQLLAKLLSLSLRFFERTSQGDLVMASFQDLKALRTITVDLSTLVLSLSRLLGLVAVTFVLSPKLAIIGLVVVPVGAIPAYWLGQRITVAARAEREVTIGFYDSFLQVNQGIKLIKVNRGERRVLERAAEIAHELYGYVIHQAQSKNTARLLLESMSGLGLITVLVIGGRDVGAGTLSWQSLMSVLIAVMAVYAPFLNLLGVYGSIRAMIPNLDRVDDIMRTPPELPDAPGARRLPGAPSTIVLEDLTFAYHDRVVLDSVSATFYRGETIGIVGPSGAGKSTLVSLMMRLYDPTRGRILFDGVDLREIRQADIMDNSAIVLQEPFLFLDTIANNIRFARPSASMEDVIAAARAANIHDEITLTDRGYETVVGRRRDARGVSVGQKQRICIAAALLKNAPILYLDEATSNLDSVSERAVQGAIETLMEGRTSFVIAHRLSTLRAVDRILVLDRGRLVGLDTHEALLATCPTYQQLWQYQLATEGEEQRWEESKR